MNKFIKVVLLLFLIYRISIRRFWKRQNRGGARTTWLYEKHISKSHIQLTFAWLNSFCIYPCLKIIQIRSFFWSLFSRIQTEYGEILRISGIQFECGKIQIRKNSVFGHFSRSVCFKLLCASLLNLPSNSSQKF